MARIAYPHLWQPASTPSSAGVRQRYRTLFAQLVEARRVYLGYQPILNPTGLRYLATAEHSLARLSDGNRVRNRGGVAETLRH